MRTLAALFCAVLLTSCTKASNNTNHLVDEKSPYLKQHATNPIWWYPWGAEAFARAKRENKPVFLSIGYSTCHWCHVMERESYSQPDVAAELNKNYVAIKVDREERPDVDALYMAAQEVMNGNGGWPLNMVLTPDRKPFFGGTYFSKSQLLDVLGQIAEAWQKDPQKISTITAHLEQSLIEERQHERAGDFTLTELRNFYKQFKNEFDTVHGGKKGAPKFIPSHALKVLLRIARRTGNPDALSMVEKTLDQAARGGIYDHVGGGFHRYSTDDHWFQPHFEKMLYDQSAMIDVYLEAYQKTGNPEDRAIVSETADYVLRELTSPEGAFYSAEDADSEGVEGKYYLWTVPQLKLLLSTKEFNVVKQAYGLKDQPNFESSNIFVLQPKFSRARRSAELQAALEKLRNARAKRVHPLLDKKIITSWNGLMIASLARAGRTLNETKYSAAAAKAAQFILNNLKDSDHHLARRLVEGEAKITPYDEDYAFTIHGLLELYQTDFDPTWLDHALQLQNEQDLLFWRKEGGGYFLTTGQDPLLLERDQNFFDNVTPTGNSISVLNLLRLADLTLDSKYAARAVDVLKAYPETARKVPLAFPQLMVALDYRLDEAKEIALLTTKEDLGAQRLLEAVTTGFQPNQVLAKGLAPALSPALLKDRRAVYNKATAYVCVHQSCQLPTAEPKRAQSFVEKISGYAL